jgi:hypothetical protein
LKAPLRRKAEGLRAVRRFGDDLSDLRASAYAFDGTRRTTTGAADRTRSSRQGLYVLRSRLNRPVWGRKLRE